MKQTVDNILKSDDKLLLSLQKLASDLDPGQSGDGDIIARIRELCARYLTIFKKHYMVSNVVQIDQTYGGGHTNETGPDLSGYLEVI